jgi:phenylalanine-4-hydroxylase
MRSAEFYQAYGRLRQEELLEEARHLRAARLYGWTPGSRLVAGLNTVRRRLAGIYASGRETHTAAWAERGKPVHG